LKHNKPVTEPINFGTGEELSILDLANMIIDICGKNGTIKPVHVEPRTGEVKRLIADSTKARNLLGWEAKYDFKEGLGRFIQWYKEYGVEKGIKIG
jgi:UDP-glucose 4-epimerase